MNKKYIIYTTQIFQLLRLDFHYFKVYERLYVLAEISFRSQMNGKKSGDQPGDHLEIRGRQF